MKTRAAKGRLDAWSRIAIGSVLSGAVCCAAICFGHAPGSAEMLLWPGDGMILALMLGPCRRTPFAMLVAGVLCILLVSLFYVLYGMEPSSSVLFNLPAMDAIVVCRVTVTYLLTRRFLGAATPIHSSRGLIAFLFAACASSVLFGAIKMGVYAIEGEWRPFSLSTLFIMAVTATMAGYAVLTPALVLLTNRDLAERALAAPKARSLVIVGLLWAGVLTVFSQSHYPLLYLAPLMLMGAAYVTDLFTAALAFLASCALIVVLFLTGHGPANLIVGSSEERLLFMQGFLVVLAFTSLPVAALMGEHASLEQSLINARIEADAANQAKSIFLANMSHEIRTPLNGVLGMAQAIALGELPPNQRERLQVLHQSGEALLTILNDVLDLSKIEAGKLVVEALEFDLGDVLRNAAETYGLLAREKGLAFELDIGDAEGVYLGDPNRLRQILYNLVANALKFTSEGSIRLAARYGEDRLSISVSDSGIGIPADKLSKLFVKFSQVDESTTRNFGGTGLGLSICRELAELMGGTITASSVEGQGARFILELPLERIDAPLQDQAAAPDALTPEPRRMRVLAAEDNATNRLVLRTLLQIANVDLVLVENGAEAVEAFSTGAWDAILMDVQMPVMDGPAATRQIRRLEAELALSRTPIVALTANTMAHQIAGYLEAGMDFHLPKPIEVERLFEILSACMGLADGAPVGRAVG